MKVSSEDLAWLEPDTGPRGALDARAAVGARGPALVLLTDGGAPLGSPGPAGR